MSFYVCFIPYFKAKHILRQSNMIETLVNIVMRSQLNKSVLMDDDDLFDKYHYIFIRCS